MARNAYKGGFTILKSFADVLNGWIQRRRAFPQTEENVVKTPECERAQREEIARSLSPCGGDRRDRRRAAY